MSAEGRKKKRRLSRVENQRKIMDNDFVIHCIGDSHVNFFTGYDSVQIDPESNMIKNKYQFFKIYWIGPVLAYNLCMENTTTKGREKLFELLEYFPAGSNLMFCFGEIDCRAHIIRQAEKQEREPEDIVKNVVDRYFSVLKEVREAGYNVIVWNVIPSAPNDINSRLNMSKEYLFHGTWEERNAVTRQFNKRLKLLIKKEGDMFFLDFFDKLMNSDGTVKTEYYCKDDIHISQEAMPIVLEELSNGFSELKNFKL